MLKLPFAFLFLLLSSMIWKMQMFFLGNKKRVCWQVCGAVLRFKQRRLSHFSGLYFQKYHTFYLEFIFWYLSLLRDFIIFRQRREAAHLQTD